MVVGIGSTCMASCSMACMKKLFVPYVVASCVTK